MERLALGRRALDIFPFPALLIDKDYQVVFMNKRAKELYTQSGQVCYQISHSFSEPYTADPLSVGEKIRKLINAISIDGYGPLSVSVGATTYREGDTIDSMIQRADSALYSAKRKGENGVELA
jgi:GGDEF domain-containing protein